jgi:hypothetical protein
MLNIAEIIYSNEFINTGQVFIWIYIHFNNKESDNVKKLYYYIPLHYLVWKEETEEVKIQRKLTVGLKGERSWGRYNEEQDHPLRDAVWLEKKLDISEKYIASIFRVKK